MLTSLFILLSLCYHAHARFDFPTCCSQANEERSLFTWNDQTSIYQPLSTSYWDCDQQYNASIPPAESIYVSYQHCKSQCGGFELAIGSQPSGWAAPLVQFILPAIIFSLGIPRSSMFVPKIDVGMNLISSSFLGLISAVLTAIDTLILVSYILMLAGPLTISALVEALLDHRVLSALSPEKQYGFDDASRLRLLVTVICGNLVLQEDAASTAYDSVPPDPVKEVVEALEKRPLPDQQAKLLNLMGSQDEFSEHVSAPVLFYLGGFIYCTLDLFNHPSEQDTALALAFGVKWMIIVNVAIITGCLLARRNPCAVSILADQPPVEQHHFWQPLLYESRYQPVSILERGLNKEKWLKAVMHDCDTRGDHQQQQALRAVYEDVRIHIWTRFWVIFMPTIILIGLPPVAGAVVAWKTPPSGWGCRSLTLVCYVGMQIVVMQIHEMQRYATNTPQLFPWIQPEGRSSARHLPTSAVRILCVLETGGRWSLQPLYWLACAAALFTAIGGTLMQTMGVYKNCFCSVNAGMWFNLDEAFIEVATDTQAQRDSTGHWLVMGCLATGFIIACAYVGWWYQMVITTECRRRIEEMSLVDAEGSVTSPVEGSGEKTSFGVTMSSV